MKKTGLLFLFFLLRFIAYSQVGNPVNGNIQGFLKNAKDMNIARMYGKVIDSRTKKPVEYASVVLLWFNKDSLIAGCLAKENGDFALENLPPYGGYRLRITFLGYKKFETKVYISPPNKLDQDLGDLKLEPDMELLKEVEVSAEKSTFVMSVDRKVYNVDKDLSVKGGTALDVMKNIPSITVDADGNATLRESAVHVYIDGRPTTLNLMQIPSDQIERVEVISNPSVKFDASATGGIINVVLKKNSKPGYNGMLMGNIGTGDRYGLTGNLNVKENPLNISLMYSLNTQINNNNGFTNRQDLYNGSTISYFNQSNVNRMANMFNTGRLGIDYHINNRNMLTFSGNVSAGRFKNNDLQAFELLNASDVIIQNGYRINNSVSGFENYTSQLLYKKTYPVIGKEFNMDVNHNFSYSRNFYDFNTYNKDANGTEILFSPDRQINTGGGKTNQLVFQMDYVNPKTEKTKIEMGLRSFYKYTWRFNNTSNFNYPADDFEKDTILSNNYIIDEMINAAYINYSAYTFWDIGYQAGLRFEQTYFKGNITDKKQTFQYIYPGTLNTIQNSLFPGMYLSKKFGKKHEVQFNISRKIDRPNFFQTMPYIMFADKKNYRIGNPELRPEFINISEINYNNLFEKGNWLSSVYGRYSEQPISNTAYPSAFDSSVLVNTFVNGKNSFRYGMENTFRYTFFKKLTATVNFDVFYVQLRSDAIFNQPQSVTRGWSYKGKLSLSYKLPWEMTFQTNANYDAPKVVINGRTLPVFFMDVSLAKNISTKWVFNLTLSDVFNSKRMGTDLETDFFIQSLSRRRETRYLRFSVTYLFGKFDASILKKRNQRGNTQTMGGGDGLDF